MNEVTVVAGVVALVILLLWWIRQGIVGRAVKNVGQVVMGSVPQSVATNNGMGLDIYTGPTMLGDDVTLAPVSSLLLTVERSRSNQSPGTRYKLTDGINSIGRAPTAEPRVHLIPIEKDPAVSSNHLYIEMGRNGRLQITDRGSRYGTRLNGQRLEPDTPQPLSIGDRLKFGNTTYVLEQEGEATDTESIHIGPRYEFHIVAGSLNGQTLTMNQDQITIGRSPDSDWQLPDDKVSRHHAEVRREGSIVQIYDRGSTAGLFVNGRRYRERALETGDVVKLGDTELRFEQVYR